MYYVTKQYLILFTCLSIGARPTTALQGLFNKRLRASLVPSPGGPSCTICSINEGHYRYKLLWLVSLSLLFVSFSLSLSLSLVISLFVYLYFFVSLYVTQGNKTKLHTMFQRLVLLQKKSQKAEMSHPVIFNNISFCKY